MLHMCQCVKISSLSEKITLIDLGKFLTRLSNANYSTEISLATV